jgi:lipoate-protein ligase B
MNSLQVRRLGLVPYADGLELQRQLVDERKADRIPDTLLLLQHPTCSPSASRKTGARTSSHRRIDCRRWVWMCSKRDAEGT